MTTTFSYESEYSRKDKKLLTHGKIFESRISQILSSRIIDRFIRGEFSKNSAIDIASRLMTFENIRHLNIDTLYYAWIIYSKGGRLDEKGYKILQNLSKTDPAINDIEKQIEILKYAEYIVKKLDMPSDYDNDEVFNSLYEFFIDESDEVTQLKNEKITELKTEKILSNILNKNDIFKKFTFKKQGALIKSLNLPMVNPFIRMNLETEEYFENKGKNPVKDELQEKPSEDVSLSRNKNNISASPVKTCEEVYDELMTKYNELQALLERVKNNPRDEKIKKLYRENYDKYNSFKAECLRKYPEIRYTNDVLQKNIGNVEKSSISFNTRSFIKRMELPETNVIIVSDSDSENNNSDEEKTTTTETSDEVTADVFDLEPSTDEEDDEDEEENN